MEERTASLATSGQIKDLAATVVQGVPVDLPEETAKGHLAHKSDVHKWIELGLAHDLSQIDFPLVEALLEGRLALRFSNDDRQKLESDGWGIVEIPGGMTLHDMPEEALHDCYGKEFQPSPTRYQEVAWSPSEPIWPSSRSKTYTQALWELREVKVRDKYGSGVCVLFPTPELTAYLYFHCPGLKRFIYTWTITTDKYVQNCLCLNLSQKGLMADKVNCDYFEGDLGVFRLIGPSF